jgi:hypothetical protein
VTASIAAVWTPTAASARTSEPDAPTSPADTSPRQSGINAGTSIKPAPCALDIMKDQSASPTCPAGLRACRGVRPDR